MVNIIDKRFTQKNGSVANRRKFIKRYKGYIKKAVQGIIEKESIKDFTFKNKKVRIKIDGENSIDLPDIRNNPEQGVYEHIQVGNKKYKKGDKIDKPFKGYGQSKSGSNEGGGEDSFEFALTEQEFADLFFEDLALPDMIKRQFTGDSYEIRRAGYSNTGGPSSLNIKQTIIRAFMRRYALRKQEHNSKKISDDIEEIVQEGISNKTKRRKIAFLEDIDLRYNYRDRVELPSTKAVMFALMDVSGSMGETEKDIAKRFYILLNMFLKRNYKTVDIVFVRHAEWAEECEEDVFFHGRESGGTVISTGYVKIHDIIKKRYNPDNWNIYIAQASDGDNFDYDNELVEDILTKQLLPITQYMAYIEIGGTDWAGNPMISTIYEMLNKIGSTFKNLQVRVIKDYSEIFEVFRSLFRNGEK